MQNNKQTKQLIERAQQLADDLHAAKIDNAFAVRASENQIFITTYGNRHIIIEGLAKMVCDLIERREPEDRLNTYIEFLRAFNKETKENIGLSFITLP